MSWNGVKKQSLEQEIKSWCDEMEIQKYTINSQCEIDVDGSVYLSYGKLGDLKELPYKFGRVSGDFNISYNRNIKSFKNCPHFVGGFFNCNDCINLDSLEGCPKEVKDNFYCDDCKRKFTKEEVKSLCKVKGTIVI